MDRQEVINLYLATIGKGWENIPAYERTVLSSFVDELLAWHRTSQQKAVERVQLEARIDELNHLGFDKRLDNPILYCKGSKTISQDERLKQLRAAQRTALGKIRDEGKQ